MSSLRMVKLFGWEGKMAQRVLDVREEELHYLQKRRVFLMFSNLVKSVPNFTFTPGGRSEVCLQLRRASSSNYRVFCQFVSVLNLI